VLLRANKPAFLQIGSVLAGWHGNTVSPSSQAAVQQLIGVVAGQGRRQCTGVLYRRCFRCFNTVCDIGIYKCRTDDWTDYFVNDHLSSS